MKASELRIGNLFNPDMPMMVEAWMLLPESKVVFTPILLTGDWLERLGFEEYSNFNDVLFWVAKGRKSIFDFRLSIESRGLFNHLDIEVKYVHQLQNLYFASTYNELLIISPK